MGYLKILDHRGEKIPMSRFMAAGDFEGASTGRRMSQWGISSSGPNTSLYASLNSLRSRSRELVRNDPQIDGGMDTLAANLVGKGITPRWQLDDSELKEEIQTLWSDWVKESDATGIYSFYGQQELAARGVIEGGEILARFRPRRPEDNLCVPLQIQLLEGDHLDESFNTLHSNGNEIRMGIEYNRIGKRAAYHMFREHPGESFATAQNAYERVRIPASEMLHTFRPLRAGMQRGRPWLSSVIITAHELNQFDDAELVRKKGAAMFGGFVVRPPEDEEDATHFMGKRGDDDSEGNSVIALEPGTFPELPFGYDVKFSTPADVGDSYEAFTKRQDRRIARGFGGLTYEKFTGDLNGVTYSSIRAGNLEFQRLCIQIIFNVLAFQFCRPVATYWMNQAVLSGALKIPDYFENRRKYQRIKWTIDGWPWVDPEKDLKAAKGEVRSGFSSRTQKVAERGLDVEELENEIQKDNERADDKELIFDSDGRKTDNSGKSDDKTTETDPKE